ncbi:MAG: hypothetical protein AAF182_03490 [Pseudomonadota bacterium]
MDKQDAEIEKQKILQVYAALAATLILSLLPFLNAAVLSLLLGLLVLVMGYIYRGRAEANSLMENHMTFVIRTVWIGSFFAVLFMAFGAAYLLSYLDNEPLLDCMQGFMAMGSEIYHPEIFKTVFSPCQESYLAVNMDVLVTGGIIVAVPPLLYFSVRLVRGLSRALKGYRLADPTSWF